jgi:hypothetical protein
MWSEIAQKLAPGFNVAVLGVLDDLFDDRGAVPLDERADGLRELMRPFRPAIRIA